jgi:hypothetical protein
MVARYTPQAVLAANVDEAEYNALITADGKMLVQSRFAVRNNQRNFLKLNLPPTAVLWSAMVAGRPIRPGRGADGSLLLPLEKTRTGEEAPAFVVEISYLDRAPAWADKGRARLSLVSVDLPISKSRLLVHHPPLFRLSAAPGLSGSFRVTPYVEAESEALRSNPQTFHSNPSQRVDEGASELTKQLVSQLPVTKQSARPTRNLPLRFAFPHFGPSIFLMSELTSENQVPIIEIDFSRDRKRGE